MTDHDTPLGQEREHAGKPLLDAAEQHNKLVRVWGNPGGLRALTVVNHTAIGRYFMITGAVFFIIGGLMAMLMRTQLALPGQDWIPPHIYNQLFTMHGTVMMFLFAVPILEGVALYVIPKMIGARDLAFPRLSALGYYCYLFGGIILMTSVVLGIAPDTGWFMYTPLSDAVYTPGLNADFWLIGITFIEISAVAAGIELVVSIMRTRTEGMTLQTMPLFAWYILAMSLMIVFGFPPLILASILLELERAAGLPFYDVLRGGDPILWQHLFWLFGHPEVYIIFLPAAGIISTILPVFARRPMVGYRWVVVSVISTAFISFGLWVHHMFTVGIPQLAQAFFSVASMMVAVPTGIQIFAWLATLWTGRPVFEVPMLWTIGFLVIFVIGGLTGVMLALVPFNWQVHDTHFVVAHMHYVLVGGMFFPLVAGLYYWWPHLTGRMPSKVLAHWGFWLTFVGFNLTFLVMHLTGLLGMPRRVYTYDAGMGWDWPNLVSSIGGFVMAAGIAVVILDLVLHGLAGRRARINPWQADTLEWATAMPPAPYNFVSLPKVSGRHPLWEQPDLPETIAESRHGLTNIDHGRRETWGTDPVSGRIREIIHLPGNSWWPFFSALALAIMCIGLLAKVYAVALAAALATVGLLLRWAWENGTHPAAAADGQTAAGEPPLHSRTFDGPGLWGMGVTLLANGSLYMSLLFGWFYLWTVAPQWQLPEHSQLHWPLLLAASLLMPLGWLLLRRLNARLRAGDDTHLQAGLWWLGALGCGQCLLLVAGWWRSTLAPGDTAHDAVITVFLIYTLLHCALAALMALMLAWRVKRGYVSRLAPYEPLVVDYWWGYSAVTTLVSFAALVLWPLGWGGT